MNDLRAVANRTVYEPFRWVQKQVTLHHLKPLGLTFKGTLSLSIASFLFVLAAEFPAFGGNTRVQTFELAEGWNAIWLAVEPADSSPAVLFSNSPVDIAATYDGALSTSQFASDSTANMLSQLGWGVWYAPDRPDSFLTGLAAINGQRPYLIHSKLAFSLQIEGAVDLPDMRWQPNAFNLTGFCLDSLAPPTFAQFFSSSRSHQECVVYRMAGGTWRRVIDPENEAMRSGEAFWIYCDGSSDYQGPLRVKTLTVGGISLGLTGDEILIRNDTDYPLEPMVTHVVSGGSGLPLAMVVDIIDDVVGGIQPLAIPMANADWFTILPTMEAGAEARVPMALQLDKMTVAEAYTLLCIKTDLGTETWLPVLGLREDLK